MSVWTTILQMLARKRRSVGSSKIRGIAKLSVRTPSVRRSARCLMAGSGRSRVQADGGGEAWGDEFSDDFGTRGY